MITPSTLEFIGAPNYSIIFTSSMSNSVNKCIAEINITNNRTGDQSIYSFVIPDASTICGNVNSGCGDNNGYKKYNVYYTTLKLNNLIFGDTYTLHSKLTCL